MRKFIFSMLLFGMIFGIVGCAGGSNSNDDVKNPQNNQNSKMPVIKITANYLATSEEDGFVEKTVNDFVKLPVAKSVKEQEKDWNGTAYANAPVPFYKKSTISVLDENGNVTLNEVAGQVKVRGNWTTTYKKKPLRIKFDEKQSMLGLNEGNDFKNWVLLASYKDRSFLRDITGYKLGKLLSPDYYASDFKLVEVYVNDEYFGVYILAEQQEVKKNRINIDDAEDTSSTETGYLIEYDRYYEFEDEETVFELKHGSEVKDRNGEIVSEFNIESKKDSAGYTIKNDLNNTAQRDYIKNYMQTLWNECYAAVNDSTKSEAEIKAVIEQYIDIQSLVDTYLLQEIVCDPDLYITSFFMTLDMSATGNKKLTFQAPWDFDSTMGNKKHDVNEQGLFAGVVGYDVNYQRKGTGNPWMMLLVNQSWFNDLVKTKWNEVKNTIPPIISDQISTLTKKYATNFENNYKIWPMEDNDEYRPEAAACNTQSAAAGQLGNWLTSRVKTLEKGINEFVQKDLYSFFNDRFEAKPATDGSGIEITLKLKEGEEWSQPYYGVIENKSGIFWQLDNVNVGENNKINYFDDFNNNRKVTFIYPFTEKDKDYSFKLHGEMNGTWFEESFSVRAKNTTNYSNYDFSPLYNGKTYCVIDEENRVYAINANCTYDFYESISSFINSVSNFCVNYSFVKGYAAYLYDGKTDYLSNHSREPYSSLVNFSLIRDVSVDDTSINSIINDFDSKYAASVCFSFIANDSLWETKAVWSDTNCLNESDTISAILGKWSATFSQDGSSIESILTFTNDGCYKLEQKTDSISTSYNGKYYVGGNAVVLEYDGIENGIAVLVLEDSKLDCLTDYQETYFEKEN